ncbi:helix-turn-helix transcriptional regulator [Robbsia andropogonis]|uniref:helix-turn-helix transcriptional regulator n=2 Tax=Robbsia andropogonis TaxID=28092 RepID=UPI0020A1BFDB|nr:LuxR C-terminal-related transcriptional regulator [Robbsia andropogonis]MCP1116813.1 LuxR C-terminal-related transcriptional regulator [Robbsia andropogonis]MCP1126508.1 LuxR C-terminal-related transcriptional regulator [Robbsia andropogonis]
MKFLVVSHNAQEREEMKTLLRQLDRRAQMSDVRDWLQARRALSHEARDLLLCDLGSTANQTEALRLIAEHKGTLVLAGTCRELPAQLIRDLMCAGVKAVMPHSMGIRAMVRALELVLLGTHYVPPSAISLHSPEATSPEISERRLPYRRRGLGDAPLLSPRQQQIMRLVHMGSTNKGIARALGISEGTVKIHLATVFKTLGASNRAAAVAIYNGWMFEQIDSVAATPGQPLRLPQSQDVAALLRLGQPSVENLTGEGDAEASTASIERGTSAPRAPLSPFPETPSITPPDRRPYVLRPEACPHSTPDQVPDTLQDRRVDAHPDAVPDQRPDMHGDEPPAPPSTPASPFPGPKALSPPRGTPFPQHDQNGTASSSPTEPIRSPGAERAIPRWPSSPRFPNPDKRFNESQRHNTPETPLPPMSTVPFPEDGDAERDLTTHNNIHSTW